MQQLVAGLQQLLRCLAHCSRVRDIELDAYLRDRPLRRPLRVPEARLGGLGQGPHPEVLAAGDLLAALVLLIAAALERQTERVDEQLAASAGVGRDHSDSRQELDFHATSSFACALATIQAGAETYTPEAQRELTDGATRPQPPRRSICEPSHRR